MVSICYAGGRLEKEKEEEEEEEDGRTWIGTKGWSKSEVGGCRYAYAGGFVGD